MKRPILAISDMQFHSFKQHSRLVGGVNSRLLEIQSAWEYALDVGRQNGCGLIAMPGDVFEVRGALKPSVFNRVTTLMGMALAEFNIIGIPGNHDMEHYDGGDSAIDSWMWLQGNLKPETGCKILRHPGMEDIADYDVMGIPYDPDVNHFKDTFRQLNQDYDPDLILIHQGIDDFDPTGKLVTGLTARWLQDNSQALILAGHYHDPKQEGRVINVGALVQHRLSDEGSERGCWVIENVKDPASVKFYPIEGPRFMTVVDKAGINGNCRDAFVTVKAKTLKDADKLKKLVEQAGAKSVTVQIEKTFATAHTQTVTLSTPRNMLGEYLDIIPRMTPHKAAIMDLFNKVCLGGAS